MSAPERIWVQLGDIRGYGYPVELTDPASWAFRPYQPFVRADLFDALQAENDRLQIENERCRNMILPADDFAGEAFNALLHAGFIERVETTPAEGTREDYAAAFGNIMRGIRAVLEENERLRDMIFAFNKTARAEALSDMAALDADFLTDAEPHIPRAGDTATIDGVGYTLTAADATTTTDDSDAPRTP